MFNDLEEPAFRVKKALAEYKGVIEALAKAPSHLPCSKALLCGSGSTLAVFFRDEESAQTLKGRLERDPYKGLAPPLVLLTKTLTEADLAGRYL